MSTLDFDALRRKRKSNVSNGSTEFDFDAYRNRKTRVEQPAPVVASPQSQVLKSTLSSVGVGNTTQPPQTQGIDFKAEQSKKMQQQPSSFDLRQPQTLNDKLPAPNLLQTGQGIQSELKGKLPASSLLQQTGRGFEEEKGGFGKAVDNFNAFTDRLQSATTFGGTDLVNLLFEKIGPKSQQEELKAQRERAENLGGAGIAADVLGSLVSGQAAYKGAAAAVDPLIKNLPKLAQSLIRGGAAGAAFEFPRQAGQEVAEYLGGPQQSVPQRLKNVGLSAALGGLTDLGIGAGGLASSGIKNPTLGKAVGGGIGLGSVGAALGAANEFQEAASGQQQSLGGRLADVGKYAAAGAGLGLAGGALFGRFMKNRTPVETPQPDVVPEAMNVGTKARIQTKPGLNTVLEQMKPLVDEHMTPPLENPNELAKWVQRNFKAGGDDISLNEIRSLGYEDLRQLSEEMRKQITVEEAARQVAKDLGYDFDKLLSAKSVPKDLVQRARMTQELHQAYGVDSPLTRLNNQTPARVNESPILNESPAPAVPKNAAPQVTETPLNDTVPARNKENRIPTRADYEAQALRANEASDLSEGVGNFGKGISDGLYYSLWSKIVKGQTAEAGQQSAILQVAKAIRDRGGMKDISELRKMAKDYTDVLDSRVTGSEYNKALSAVVEKHTPAQPQTQDTFTNLFGEQNLGISANRSRTPGQGPVTTEDQIVRRSIKNDREGVAEAVKAQVRAVYQDHVDALDPLKKLGQDVYDTAMDANRANNIANNIVNKEFVNLQGEVVGESLKDIFTKVARGQDKKFLDFLNLRRATTRMARNEQVFDSRLKMTPEKVQERLDTLESRHPGFEAISNDYYNFWNNIRQMGVDEGLISADMKKALETAEPYYVPQMRQFSRSEKPGRDFLAKSSKQSLSGQKAPIQKLSEGGSGRPLVDARKSTIEAVGAWTNAALRNRALQPVVKALKADPDAFKGIVSVVDNTANVSQKSIKDINAIIQKDGIEGLIAEFDNNFEMVMNKGKDINLNEDNILRVMVDGEPSYLRIEDPEVVKAAISMGPQATSLLTDVMSAFSNATKRGATGLLAPLFAVKGATMDLAQSAIQARNPVKQAAYSVYSIFSGIGDSLGIPGLRNWAQDYRRQGGGYSYALKGERNVNKSIENLTKYPKLSARNAVKTTKNIGRGTLGILEGIGNIAENAPRIAASRIELERLGGEITPENIRKAMNAGRNATVNYSTKGLKTHEIEAFAPYSNAAIQGTRRILKAFKDNPVRTTAAVGTIAVLPKLIEYSRFHNDEDYQNIPARERMRNIFVSKNEDGSFVKLPMDPAYTSFGEMTIEGLRAFRDNDPNAFKGSMDALVNAWTPPLVTGLLQGLTKGDGIKGSLAGVANATVFGPPSAIISNKSFTGSPIVSKSLEDRSGRYQYDEKTSAVAKKIGELTNFSPVMADYIIKAYGGDAARIVLPLTSDVGQGNTRNTLLRNFITDPTFTNTLSEDFYNAKDKLNEAYANFNEAGAELPKWYNDEIRKALNSSAKGSVSKTLSELRDYKRQITADKTLSKKERSDKLKEIQQKINTIYVQVNAAMSQSGVIK